MSDEWEIYCTEKNKDGDIIQIGIRSHAQERAQLIDVEAAIEKIKNGIRLYIKDPDKVSHPGNDDIVYVESITSKGVTYLRSEADGEIENNLSQLGACSKDPSYHFANYQG